MDYHIDTAEKVRTLMEKLKDIESRDEAMAVALEMAATEAGLIDRDPLARIVIGWARRGEYRTALTLMHNAVGLTDEQFRSLRALIYG